MTMTEANGLEIARSRVPNPKSQVQAMRLLLGWMASKTHRLMNLWMPLMFLQDQDNNGQFCVPGGTDECWPKMEHPA
jgi:hypothetical protein